MILSEKHRFIYIAIAKTGTRSVYNILKEKYGGKEIGDHRREVPEQYKQMFTFTTVRNPYDRACSAYWSVCNENAGDKYGWITLFKSKGYKNTLANYLWCVSEGLGYQTTSVPQMFWITPNRIDYTIRMERFEYGFSKLPFVSGNDRLPHENSSRFTKFPPRPVSSALLTNEAITLINKIYREDFDHLEYQIVPDNETYLRIYANEAK